MFVLTRKNGIMHICNTYPDQLLYFKAACQRIWQRGKRLILTSHLHLTTWQRPAKITLKKNPKSRQLIFEVQAPPAKPQIQLNPKTHTTPTFVQYYSLSNIHSNSIPVNYTQMHTLHLAGPQAFICLIGLKKGELSRPHKTSKL